MRRSNANWFDTLAGGAAKFTPNYYVSDSLSVIFHRGRISDPVIWQNLLILALISLVAVVAGIQIFKKTGYR